MVSKHFVWLNKALKDRRTKIILFLAAWMFLMIFLPEAILAVVLLNLFAFTLILGLRYFSVMLPHIIPESQKLVSYAKVSIHIPTYNEPPEVVIHTLKALTRLAYPNFEVIILDNNTREEHIWRPVEKFCTEQLDDRFRFFHIGKLDGYKAGALKVCLEETSEDSEFILVIDADYQVDPGLLNEAIGCFVHDTIGLVQFPQAYFNAGNNNLGLQSEYEHFFSVYMNMANHYDCVLSTGTVSVIRRRALEMAGGWQDNTITEDVELGLRLKNAGFRGVYVPKALGRGLMPTDIQALRTQRERWIFGNMQTLKLFFRSLSKRLNLKQSFGVLALLTAWYNFLMIPVLALLTSTIVSFFSASPVLESIKVYSLGTSWFAILGTFLFFLIAFVNRKQPTRNAVEAFLVHMSLLWEGATSWISCLLNTPLGFKRTNKFPQLSKWIHYFPALLIGFLLLLAGLLLMIHQQVSLGLLSIMLSPIGLSVLFLKKQLENTAKITAMKDFNLM